MKRGSLVGPLLLIALGTLFLARNVFPELPLIDYIARFWPYLLILWGGMRLAEILVWASNGKPLPVSGISGGEWALVVFLCLMGFTVSAARGLSNWLPRANITMGGLDIFGESYDYNVAGEKPSSKSPRVVLQAFRGDARIIGADVESVKVTGRNTIRSMDKNDADKASASMPLEISGDANEVSIRTNQDRISTAQRITSTLEITVPRGASLELHGRRGDFDITGINGTVDIDSENAGVRLENIAGAVRLDVRGGDVIRARNLKSAFDLKGRGGDVELDSVEGQVNINGSFSGLTQIRNVSKPVHFVSPNTDFTTERVSGSVRISIGDLIANGITGPVRLSSTRSKDVELTDFSNTLEINLSGGDIQLFPGALATPKMEVRTKRGDIELSLPANARFNLATMTEKGESENDFGAPIVESSSGRSSTLRGSNGGPSVILETKQGTIRVRKGSAMSTKAPVPAEAPVAPTDPLRPLNQ